MDAARSVASLPLPVPPSSSPDFLSAALLYPLISPWAVRVVDKAGCVRSLPRVAVALVAGCDVGVTGTATGAAATWFPRVRVVETVAKVACSRGFDCRCFGVEAKKTL
ncbi:uncharacterized protein DS421_3g95890 [Arachis hypogaea]|nr:uncharacterized protein DS421_3g95890 [Arachis hypogaea]